MECWRATASCNGHSSGEVPASARGARGRLLTVSLRRASSVTQLWECSHVRLTKREGNRLDAGGPLLLLISNDHGSGQHPASGCGTRCVASPSVRYQQTSAALQTALQIPMSDQQLLQHNKAHNQTYASSNRQRSK